MRCKSFGGWWFNQFFRIFSKEYTFKKLAIVVLDCTNSWHCISKIIFRALVNNKHIFYGDLKTNFAKNNSCSFRFVEWVTSPGLPRCLESPVYGTKVVKLESSKFCTGQHISLYNETVNLISQLQQEKVNKTILPPLVCSSVCHCSSPTRLSRVCHFFSLKHSFGLRLALGSFLEI